MLECWRVRVGELESWGIGGRRVGELESWRVRVLECWSDGVLESWSVGRGFGELECRIELECWSAGVLEGWSVGELDSRGRLPWLLKS